MNMYMLGLSENIDLSIIAIFFDDRDNDYKKIVSR